MVQAITTVNVTESEYDQIVVDVRDLVDVVRVLGVLGGELTAIKQDWKIDTWEIDRIDAFGVVLAGVSAVSEEQVKKLDDGVEKWAAIVTFNAAAGRPDIEVTPFDVLMRIVRDRVTADREQGIGASNRNRIEMGKNRDVDQFEALPHLGGGKGLPEPAVAAEFKLYNAETAGIAALRSVADGPSGTTIGVLDSAMYPNRDLVGRYQSDNAVTARPARRAWEGHAAFVVGRILLRAPEADIHVRQVLNTNGTAKAWDVAFQMADLLTQNITILNMSLGCYTADDNPPFLIKRAAARVTDHAIIVAAAGNHGDEDAIALVEGRNGLSDSILTNDRRAKTWPAALSTDEDFGERVISVGAASLNVAANGVTLTPAAFTPATNWVTVWAPGVDVASTYLDGRADARTMEPAGNVVTVTAVALGPFDGYAKWSGTSTATGDVTGEIARISDADANLEGTLKGAEAAVREIKARPTIKVVNAADIRPSQFVTDWE